MNEPAARSFRLRLRHVVAAIIAVVVAAALMANYYLW